MSWARGTNSAGREVGYAIEAHCDHPECRTVIDRGLSYICGSDIEGGDHGCGKFFCDEHRRTTFTGPATVSLCAACLKLYEVAFQEGKPIYVEPRTPKPGE